MSKAVASFRAGRGVWQEAFRMCSLGYYSSQSPYSFPMAKFSAWEPSLCESQEIFFPTCTFLVYLVYSDDLLFLRHTFSTSFQTRSAPLVSLKAPCRNSLLRGGSLVSSGHAGAMSLGGDPVNQAGWCPREVSLYSQPVTKKTEVKNVVETATRC